MSCKLRCGGNKYKLIYFNGKGRAETIRLVLAAAGVNYEDKRIEKADWPALKPTTPWGSLPLLEVDGKTIGQSMAIARYVAREACLAGKCGVDQALVDSIVDSITDLREKFISLMFTADESAKEKGLVKFNEETLVTSLGNLDKALGGKNYFVGDKLSLADLHFYGVFEAIVGFNAGALKGHPKLKDLFDRVASNAKVAEYLKKRPATDF